MRLEQVIGGEELPEESFEPITQAEGQQMVNLINSVADLDRQGTTQEEIKHYLEGVDWIRVVEETPDGGVSCRTGLRRDGSMDTPRRKTSSVGQSLPRRISALFSRSFQGPERPGVFMRPRTL